MENYQKRKLQKTLMWWIVGLVAVALVGILIWWGYQPGELDTFAKCLEEKEVTFFGAFWCLHCQDQKALFGKSKGKLPYVECSLPSGKGQNELCNQEGIQVYPTWEFADKSRETRVMTPAELAEKTGCELPQ